MNHDWARTIPSFERNDLTHQDSEFTTFTIYGRVKMESLTASSMESLSAHVLSGGFEITKSKMEGIRIFAPPSFGSSAETCFCRVLVAFSRHCRAGRQYPRRQSSYHLTSIKSVLACCFFRQTGFKLVLMAYPIEWVSNSGLHGTARLVPLYHLFPVLPPLKRLQESSTFCIGLIFWIPTDKM